MSVLEYLVFFIYEQETEICNYTTEEECTRKK